MCDKVPYATSAEATAAARGISKSGRGHMTHYKCKHCGQFHVSSTKQYHSGFKKRDNTKYPFRFNNKKQ